MSIIDAILLGLLQGLTEFLPVSSSGHLVLAHEILGWGVEGGLAFDAVLHFATSLAVVAYFWRDITRLVQDAARWVAQKEVASESKRLIVGLIVATVPAAILGLLLEDIMETTFRNPLLIAGTLIVGSLVMLAAEKWGRKLSATLGWKRALSVGFFQSLALMPGMSRSGMAISGGMLMGLSRETAARFAFLLAVPLLLGAGAKKMFDLGSSGELAALAVPLLAGALAAFVSGALVIHWLLRFLRTRTMGVFIVYRLVLAGVLLVFLL